MHWHIARLPTIYQDMFPHHGAAFIIFRLFARTVLCPNCEPEPKLFQAEAAMLLSIVLLMLSEPAQVTQGRTFQSPGVVGDAFLSDPYSMCFAPAGGLFIADRYPSKIHQWDSEGTYLRTFAGKGEGPGELNRPLKITATADLVWTWDIGQRMSAFDHQGRFVRSFQLPGITPRNFAVLHESLFLLAYKKFHSPSELHQVFQLVSGEGVLGEVILDVRNNLILAPVKGQTNTTLKAYGPEADIQRGPDGSYYMGFSQEPVLYRLDHSGRIAARLIYDLPAAKPTAGEREVVENLSFANPRDGGRLNLKDMPNLKFDFSHPKAFFTQFLVKGDKVVFVLTPLGGFEGGGMGFHKGTWSVNDLNTGQRLSVGRFEFAEDTTVLMRNGRILGIIATNDGEYEIRELFFAGL